jgi:transporter family-2 protein
MSSGIVVAVLVGIGIAVQVSILGRSSADTSPLTISLALQLSGVAVAAVWATGRGTWTEVLTIPRHWWWIPLGAGGWALVAALGFAASRIGVASTLALSVTAQLVAGSIADAVSGTGNVSRTSVLGTAMAVAGVTLVLAGT